MKIDDFLPAQVERLAREKRPVALHADLDLLLVNPPPWMPLTPPLGCVALAGYLLDRGLGVQVLDLNLELLLQHPELATLWRMEQAAAWAEAERSAQLFSRLAPAVEAWARAIVQAAPRCLGFSVMGGKQRFVRAFLTQLLELGYEGGVLFGGPACINYGLRQELAAPLGRHERVAFVLGEGEGAALRFLDSLRKGRPVSTGEGLLLLGDESPDLRLPTGHLPLDDLPRPRFDLVPSHGYLTEALPLEWSRGCVGRCAFCDVATMWGGFRIKSAGKRLAELEHLVGTTGTTVFTPADPALNSARRPLLELCRALVARGLAVTWSGHAVVSKLYTAEDYRLMRSAGCRHLEFGVESGSDRVLAAMGKHRTVAEAEQTLRLCHESGIHPTLYLIVGFPGEDRDDLEASAAFLRRNRAWIDSVRSVNALYLQRETPLWERRGSLGLEFGGAESHEGHHWSVGSHTLEERQYRVRRLLEVIDELGIPYHLAAGLDEFS